MGYPKSANETALDDAIANIGPISVMIDGSQSAFQLYTTGIYNDPKCNASTITHGITLVGYGSNYYIAKNSWGTGWGKSGYVKWARTGSNFCGIANYPAYPII
jgi:C1A family cysteine protease